MAENLHKGWLYTRDNERFAPATLIESVYDRDGSSYLTTLKRYFNAHEDLVDTVDALNTSTNERFDDVAEQVAALESQDDAFTEQLKYFDGSASDKLYIVDTKSNVIAYVDDSGVHSIDFTIPTSGISLKNVANGLEDLTDIVDQINEKLTYFDGSSGEAFFFIDTNKNVVAYVDGSGIHATNLFTTEGDFNDLVARIVALEDVTIPAIEDDIADLQKMDSDQGDLIADLYTKLQYFDGSSSEGFYIIDNNKNVVAYIDSSGVHSINFSTDNNDFNNIVTRVENIEDIDIPNLESDIANLQQADIDLNDLIVQLTERLQYFDGSSGEAFYFVDKNKNVVAYIKDGGVYSVDFFPDEGRSLKELNADFDSFVETFNTHETEYKEWNEQQDKTVEDLTDIVDALQEAVGLPLASGSPTYDSGVSDLYNQVIKNKTTLATAIASYTTTGSIWNQIKGDATKYFTLGTIEDVLGTSDSDTGTALNRIYSNEEHINNIYDVIGNDTQGNSDLWTAINGIQSVFGDIFNGDAFYIIDSNKNAIAYFNGNGLKVTNVTLMNGVQSLGYNPEKLGTSITVTDIVLDSIE